MNIERVNQSDDLKTFLSNAGLPVTDLGTATPVQFFAGYEGALMIGVIGVEMYHRTGLLRSLAVDHASRESGCGRKLVAHAEAWANEHGIESFYLLTTTAHDFFKRLGYTAISRSLAPNPVAGSAQFSGVCPESAIFMLKML